MHRVGIGYLLLFMISYVASMAYLRPQTLGKAAIENAVASVAPVMQQLPKSAKLITNKSTMAEPVSAQVDRHRELNAAKALTKPAELSPLPAVALSVDYTSHDNAYTALDVITQSDERPEYRLAAVGALHALAANGDANGRIRESLRMATADGDPRVAAAADVAYQEVSAWASTR